MVYKTFKKVSNVCQLLDKSKYHATTTSSGVTFTNNGDGTITANGTATAFTNILVDTVTPTIIKSGHKFLMLGCPLSNGNITTSKEYWMQEGYEFCSDHGVGGFFSLKGNNINLRVYIQKDYTANNLVFKPQVFDLTEMYGAGHEPTSVEQFRQDFPEEMYDYSPYCFVKSYKTLLKASDYCQLLDKSKFAATETIRGVTFTNNGDGTITVNGTNSGEIYYNLEVITSIHVGHKVIIDDRNSTLYFFGDMRTKDNVLIGTIPPRTIFTLPSNLARLNMLYYVRYNSGSGVGQTYNNELSKPQLFDLTEMFGAGNEPTTVAQFRENFPNELYDYKPYSIIPSHKKSLVCKTKNLLNPNTCNIYQSVAFGMNIELIDNNQTVHVYGTSTDTGAFASFNVIKTSDKSIYNKGYKIKFFNLTGKNPPVIRNIYGLCEVDTVGQIAITVNITEGVYYDFSFRIMVSEQTATDYVPYGHL